MAEETPKGVEIGLMVNESVDVDGGVAGGAMVGGRMGVGVRLGLVGKVSGGVALRACLYPCTNPSTSGSQTSPLSIHPHHPHRNNETPESRGAFAHSNTWRRV